VVKFGTSLACAAALLFATVASAEVMDNATVLNLAKAGLSEQVIIDKINSEPCGYDVSTDGIIALKRAGLSEGVISAMVRRCATLAGVKGVAGDDFSPNPKVRHSPGIYVMQSWSPTSGLQKLRPSKSSGVRTSGNGSILFPLVAKLTLTGTESHIPVMAPAPVFYFYFNPSDTTVSDFGQENSVAAQSPSEFTLVRFHLKGDTRELDMGKMSAYGGSIMSYRKGINPKSALKVDTEEQGNGIFKVTVPQPLESGEYAFVFSGANGTARIYDFSVKGTAMVSSASAPTTRP
jgi:hypothetical protein